jgi:hypothetical protein
MFIAVLSLHILAAVIMGATATVLLFGAFRGVVPMVERSSRVLTALLGFELLSGSALAFLSPNAVSFGGFCQNVLLYLTVTVGLLAVAHLRTGEGFPSGLALAPALSGLFVSTLTAVHLW